MPYWSATAANVNLSMQNAFGESVEYQPMQAGEAVGTASTITIIRRIRERMEAGAVASVEEIDVNPTDLPALPARGDVVEAWGAVFTVTTVRQPDPYGMIHLTLTMQPPSQ
jgi:hypothetical protein